MNKKELVDALQKRLEEQRAEMQNEILSVNEEIGKETKSSAGDKFETSREMMNQERNRLEERIAHINQLIKALKEIPPEKKSDSVGNGSLVQTDSKLFFFGLAFGKFLFNREEVMVLSLQSPIGKAFLSKEKGDKFSFMKNEYKILTIN